MKTWVLLNIIPRRHLIGGELYSLWYDFSTERGNEIHAMTPGFGEIDMEKFHKDNMKKLNKIARERGCTIDWVKK